MSGQDREVIGDFVELRFVSLPSSSFIRGKVDTGATICSLHCEKFQVNEQSQQITFKCRQLSNNSITVPMTEQQAVKTSDKTEYRPVIEMSVKVGNQVIEKVKFNLNNRSTMDTPVLIGQNLIKAGNFLIDPKQVAEAMSITRMDDEEDIGIVREKIKGLKERSDLIKEILLVQMQESGIESEKDYLEREIEYSIHPLEDYEDVIDESRMWSYIRTQETNKDASRSDRISERGFITGPRKYR